MRAIKYISLGDATGYAIAAKGHIRALVEAGIPVTWEPMIPGGGLGLGHEPGHPLDVSDPILVSAYKRRIEYDRVIIHTIPEYYPHFVQRERPRMSGDGRILGSTVWETDRLPRHWPSLLVNLDGLIVPTEWNREVFRASGVNTSIAVVPHASEFEGKRRDDGAPLQVLKRCPDLAECFVFYSINAWLERKGLPLLITSFCDAFTGDDRVALLIKTTATQLDRSERSIRRLFRRYPAKVEPVVRKILQKKTNPPRVVLVTESLGSREMQAIHRIGDCYISLCRGEGWGLGAYEAAWLGKPVIMTGFGGHTAFLPAALSYQVKWRLAAVSVPDRNPSYTPDQHWAEPDCNHASALMRQIVLNPDQARSRGESLRQYVTARFRPEVIGTQLLSALEPA